MPNDPMNPGLDLLSKLASIALCAEDLFCEPGRVYDCDALSDCQIDLVHLLSDPAVRDWIKEIAHAAFGAAHVDAERKLSEPGRIPHPSES